MARRRRHRAAAALQQRGGPQPRELRHEAPLGGLELGPELAVVFK
jgi:hypothetical protein